MELSKITIKTFFMKLKQFLLNAQMHVSKKKKIYALRRKIKTVEEKNIYDASEG